MTGVSVSCLLRFSSAGIVIFITASIPHRASAKSTAFFEQISKANVNGFMVSGKRETQGSVPLENNDFTL